MAGMRNPIRALQGGDSVMSVFGSDGTDPEEASGLLQPQDTLDDADGLTDVLDTGWSPPERPWAVDDWGLTEREEVAGESLDGRLTRECPEFRDVEGDVEGDGLGDTSDTDGELVDGEVGRRRAGRLVESETTWGDFESELHAVDVGIDGAAASAEEGAVHLVDERDEDRW
jgi:uncharacterized protein DUF5709